MTLSDAIRDMFSKRASSPAQRAVNAGAPDAAENPTEGQKRVGNYQKVHLNLDGFRISIENPKGSYRSGTSPDGTKWRNMLACDYGDIRGTESVDKPHEVGLGGGEPVESAGVPAEDVASAGLDQDDVGRQAVADLVEPRLHVYRPAAVDEARERTVLERTVLREAVRAHALQEKVPVVAAGEGVADGGERQRPAPLLGRTRHDDGRCSGRRRHRALREPEDKPH